MKKLNKKKDGNKMILLIEKIKMLSIILFFIGCLMFCSYVETTYTREGKIINIDNNNIFIKDSQGNIWVFNENELHVGDKVKLILDNHLTRSDITDDVIRKIKRIK